MTAAPARPKFKRGGERHERAKATTKARRIAAIYLGEVTRLVAFLHAHGEIVDHGHALAALADALASSPGGEARTGRYRGKTFGLTFDNLKNAARDARLLDATDAEVDRAFEARRRGPTKRTLKRDALAKTFGVTEKIRAELRLTQIGATDCTVKERLQNRRRRDAKNKAKRRAEAGATPRKLSLSQTKPWVAAGVSRATHYRRKKGNRTADADPIDETNSAQPVNAANAMTPSAFDAVTDPKPDNSAVRP